ncbi:hypothetical protein TCE0_043f15975 [Talaromyces pinophilus]|uniref:Uncharacterized protein n=1 Tax=Talaromyces pinophilus TaxID=128442 RepID=A0A0B8MYV7_TALPI|nr:hypothetical protein TCE0_043f15975 [Talaromyces pinophilus]
METPSKKEFQIGWICALPIEAAAAIQMLDENFGILQEQERSDTNTYTLGRIGRHHVVIACLPDGQYGTTSATTVAINMMRTFSDSLRIGLMVGIGGGAPSAEHDIRLGDIVISRPQGSHGGVIQHDMRKINKDGKVHLIGSLNSPPKPMLNALAQMRAAELYDDPQYPRYLQEAIGRNTRTRKNFSRPDDKFDRLFKQEHEHLDDATSCDLCPVIWEEDRFAREDSDPHTHYGTIASGNTLIKNGKIREAIRKETEQQITTILSTVKEIRKDTHSTDATVKKLSQRGDDQEFQIIMNWLTPVNYALQQSDLIARRQEGTGEWLLKSNQFQQWLAQSNQTLFCPGMPGAGKTILTSIVIRYLHDKFGNDPTVGIAYLYCNFRQQHEQKSADLVVSLLKQLAQEQPSVPEAVRNLYNLHKAKQTRPSPDEIRNILHHIAVTYSRIFIIVDALDECQLSYEGREVFLREIFHLQAKAGINIFATSRYIQDIEAKFDQSIRLEIRASDTDVERYLDQKLQDFPSWILKDSSLQTEIKSKIARAVDGMFLLAQLYVDSLARKTTTKAIRIALGELEVLPEAPNDRPKTLDRAYLEAMERIQVQTPEHRELAMQALSWISCAKRRLTSAELQHALAVEVKESLLDPENIADIGFVVSMCAGLVTFDKESDVIRLVHYTTQEYFERNWATWFPNAHTDITEKCVTYLLFQDFEAGCTPTNHDLVERFKSHILYHYAAQNWGYHAVESSIEGGELILDLLKTKSKVSACSQAMLYDGYGLLIERYERLLISGLPYETEMTGMHLAAYFGLSKSTSALLEISPDADAKDYFGRTPLSWAAENGHEAVIKLLLDKNADVEVTDGLGQTPLSQAAINDEYGQTPLSWAAEKGHEAVVKLLLDKNADVDSKDKHGQTPLSWAANHGHEAVVKLLLSKYAGVDSKDYGHGQISG